MSDEAKAVLYTVLIRDRWRPYLFDVTRETEKRLYGVERRKYLATSRETFKSRDDVLKVPADEKDRARAESYIAECHRREGDARAWLERQMKALSQEGTGFPHEQPSVLRPPGAEQ